MGSPELDEDAIMVKWGDGVLRGDSKCSGMIWLKAGRGYYSGQGWAAKEEAFESLPSILRC